MSVPVDEAKLGEFMGQMAGYMTGGALCFSMWLGDELGLYRVLNGAGPLKAERWPRRPGVMLAWCVNGWTARPPVGWSPTTGGRHLRADSRGGHGPGG